MEKKVFNPDLLNLSMPHASPKLVALFDKIATLDARDMEKDGKLYKHMIFTDLQSSAYGLKLLASAFVAKGYIPAFEVHGSGFSLHNNEKLLETKDKNFGVLSSKSFFDRSMSTRFKKAELEKFNHRPDNTHGKLIRFMILDQGFKEGIDLFDIKYVHLFEPLVVRADEKQAIGRGTRFCGQKGLEFHPRFGWPLYVFRYDVTIPEDEYDARTMAALFFKYSNVDMRRVVFAAEIERASQEAAVDHALTAPIHQFTIETPPPALAGGAAGDPLPPRNIMNFGSLSAYIRSRFQQFKYPEVRLQNMCQGGGAPNIVSFTPTQDFIRHYFQPSSGYKGMLLYHSVGTGKTCTAIATATTSFEQEGYNILWVTRHTLKSDIWKNMYNQVCSLVIQDQLKKKKLKLPDRIAGPMKFVSDRWMEPMSYKQFSNMLLKKNKFYEEIVSRNGKEDPLHKTLIIIDEAHKLYAPNVVGSEKPRMDILEEMIQNSYRKSGKQSCRLLLMTATPYTEDGMEMVNLLNLLRPASQQFPNTFDAFAKKYLDDHGYFTKKGAEIYRNDVSGYISYLNRSSDARNFSHPVLENVLVPMTTPPEDDEPPRHMDKRIKELQNQIKEAREQQKEVAAGLKEEIRELKKRCKEAGMERVNRCKEEAKTAFDTHMDAAKTRKENALEECKDKPRNQRKACKDEATAEFRARGEELKEKKKRDVAECAEKKTDCGDGKQDLDRKQHELETHKERVTQLKEEKATARAELKELGGQNKELTAELKELKPHIKTAREERKRLQEQLAREKKRLKAIKDKVVKKEETKRVQQSIGAEYKETDKEYKKLRAKAGKLMNEKKLLRIKMGRATLGDISQKTALLNKCKV
jgi:hypothetical protein